MAVNETAHLRLVGPPPPLPPPRECEACGTPHGPMFFVDELGAGPSARLHLCECCSLLALIGRKAQA